MNRQYNCQKKITKTETMICKTLHRKLKIESPKPSKKKGNSGEVNSICSTNGTCRVTLCKKEDETETTTKKTCIWSSAQIFGG